MNAFSSIVSILFITVPQSVIQPYKNSTFSSWDLLLGNVRERLDRVIPIARINFSLSFFVSLLFAIFQGFFTNSILYYGFYANHTLMVDYDTTYDIPTAYFSTFAFCYIFVFILLFFK